MKLALAIPVMGALASSACYQGVDGWGSGGDGAESTGGSTSSSGGTDEGDLPDPDLEPAPPTMHRLTTAQLHNTYVAVLGLPLELPTNLPADDLLYGSTAIAAAGATIAPLAAEQYEAATYFVLDQVWADPVRRASLVGCEPAAASDPCVAEFLAAFAKKAWRRPVEDAEIDALVALT